VKPEGKNGAKNVSTDGLMADRVPHEEWVEMFNKCGGGIGLFYAANMHGLRLECAEGAVPAAGGPCRAPVGFKLRPGRNVAELSVGHAYIEGGDYEMPKRPQVR